MIPKVEDTSRVIPLNDIIEKSINSYIINPFFPWVFLLLLINGKKNYKRKVNFILVFHWFFRATGDALNSLVFSDNTIKENEKYYWPYNKHNQYRCINVAYIFWTIGEILGDWYLLLRVKAVSDKNYSMKSVYITCILYNLTKINGVILRFIRVPENYIKNLSTEKNSYYPNRDIFEYKLMVWTIILIIQIFCFIYDITVIFALKNFLYIKLKEYNTNSIFNGFKKITDSENNNNLSFIDLMKTMSEFRIILSMISSFFFIPFVILFIFVIIKEYQNVSNIDLYKASKSNFEEITSSLNNLRDVVLGIDYTFMYIDQFLLIYLAAKKEKKYHYNSSRNDLQNNDTLPFKYTTTNNYDINYFDINSPNSYVHESSHKPQMKSAPSYTYLISLASLNRDLSNNHH